MADDEVANPLGSPTTNYGWTKPTVGADVDAWGGMLNADLDGIDSVVHGIDVRPAYVLPTASTTVLGGVKVDGSTITIAGGVISGTPSSGPPVTISDTAPASPQVGALWFDSAGGQLYTWFNDGNSSQWTIVVNPGVGATAYLPLNGGALSGPVSGPSATFANLSAPQAIGDNRIINGDMRIDQRWNGSNGTAYGYTVDRWKTNGSQTNKGQWGRNLNAAAGPTGFPYYLGFQSSSAYALTTSDYFLIEQFIEADMVSDFAWGTASAQPATLSFWALSSLTGTFSATITNAAFNRTYPFSYSLAAANTWTKIVIIIPGDTTGTWVQSGAAASVVLQFDLGSGATARGPANAWAGAWYVGATGAQSIVATLNATFYVTGVKLEIGSVATPYNRQSLAKSMADCQRYYVQSGVGLLMAGYASVGGYGASLSWTAPVTMRAAPTVVGAWGSGINANAGAISALADNRTIQSGVASAAAGQFSATLSITSLSAEL